jgi:hypothetical protein
MLPPNDVPTGTFTVHNLGTPVRFNASGLDYGEFGFTAIVNRLVQYK